MLKKNTFRYHADYSKKLLEINPCIKAKSHNKRFNRPAFRGINRIINAEHSEKQPCIIVAKHSALLNGVKNGKNVNQCDSERRGSSCTYQR